MNEVNKPLLNLASLIDEVLKSNPFALRLNALRLGLTDEGTPLSRQALMKAILDWKAKNNATERQVSDMMYELLSTEKAIHHTIVQNSGDNVRTDYMMPTWAVYMVGGLLLLGALSVIVIGAKLIQKLIT
jgi:hypothetical protein